MSHNPALLLIYGLLVVFFIDVGWLFYRAYRKDRGSW